MATKLPRKQVKKTPLKAVKKAVKKNAVKPGLKKSGSLKAKSLSLKAKKKIAAKSKVSNVKEKKILLTQKATKVMPKKKENIEVEKKKRTRIPQNGSQEVEVTSPRKIVKKIKGYGKEDLEYFRKIILEKRNEIIEQLQNLREQMMDPTTGQYVNENSPYSLHMAEQGTDAMEREKIFLWAQRENKFLGYLDDALHRIENGTYGICIECIEEPQNLCPTCPLIPKERLAAVPHSQLCLPVKQKQERAK